MLKRKFPFSNGSRSNKGGQKRFKSGGASGAWVRRNPFKGSTRRTTVAFNQGPVGVADQTIVRLKYVSQVALASAGALATNVYSGNSCFDPDVTGTGHQPYFFDQWATFYADYTCLGSSIKVTPTDQTPTPVGKIVTVVPSDGKTAFSSTDVERIQEQPYAKSNVTQASTNLLSIRSYMSTGKIYGLRKDIVNTDAIFIAPVGASPVGEWYWHVGFHPLDQATPSTVHCRVEITYYVKFSSRQRPASS